MRPMEARTFGSCAGIVDSGVFATREQRLRNDAGEPIPHGGSDGLGVLSSGCGLPAPQRRCGPAAAGGIPNGSRTPCTTSVGHRDGIELRAGDSALGDAPDRDWRWLQWEGEADDAGCARDTGRPARDACAGGTTANYVRQTV